MILLKKSEKIRASMVKCIRNGKEGKCEKKKWPENLQKTDHGTHGGKANIKTIFKEYNIRLWNRFL